MDLHLSYIVRRRRSKNKKEGKGRVKKTRRIRGGGGEVDGLYTVHLTSHPAEGRRPSKKKVFEFLTIAFRLKQLPVIHYFFIYF